MQSVYVYLPTVKEVQAFVRAISGLDGSFDFVSGDYILDARSLMGIFNFDLTRPIELRIYDPNPASLAAIAPFWAAGTQTAAHSAGGTL